MITLHEYTETAFTNNGLGCLNDATSCVVKETLNGEYELEMEYPVNGIHYSDIQLRRIILAKPNSYDQTQPFRIYAISKPIGGLVTVNAEHISYDMSGLPVRGALEHYAWYVNDVFEHIKNNSVYPCPFTFSTDITEEKKDISLSKPRSVRAFLGTEEGLLSLFGGEWEFNRYNATLYRQRGQNRGVSIEYGKNLTDVTQDEKCSEMYTAVYPYYYQEDDGLQRLDDDVVKILDSPYKNVYVLDLTSEFEEMPTQDQLRAKTQEYIKENKLGEPTVSLKVSFIKNPEVIESLHDVRLGDTVGVKFIKIGVDTTSRCISYEFNVLTEQYNSIELGEPTKTIVDTMTSTSSKIDAANGAIEDTKNDLSNTKDDLDDTKEDLTEEIDRATKSEGELHTRITKTEEGLEAEVSQRQKDNLELSTRISQTPHKIGLTASGGENSVGITIQLYDENGNLVDTSSGEANITVTGFVKFTDLAQEGSTTINGSNITTGIIRSTNSEFTNATFYEGVDFGYTWSGSSYTFPIFSVPSLGTLQFGGSGLHTHMPGSLEVDGAISHYGSSVVWEDDLSDYINNVDAYADSDKGTTFYYSIQHHGHILEVRRRAINTSDERLKTDLIPLDDLTDIYMSFEPISYHFNPGLSGYEKELQYGLSAQKVEKAFLDHGITDNALVWKVAPDKDFHEDEYTGGDLVYHLDKDQLHAMHIQMIQKQQHEIETLKLENAQVKEELDSLEQRLNKIEEQLKQ